MHNTSLNPERMTLLTYNIIIAPFQGSKIRFVNKATIISSLRDSTLASSIIRT
jgi:hypothetical protein